MSKTPPSDSYFLATTLLIGLLCAIPLTLPFYPVEINSLLRSSIPLPIAQFFILLPFIMKAGLSLTDKQHSIEKAEFIAKLRAKHRGRLCFSSHFSSHEYGTEWSICNQSSFAWTKAFLLIERSYGGLKESDKIPLKPLKMGEKCRVSSHIVDIRSAKWRVMVVSKEGQSLDFPERVRESPWQQQALSEQ